MKPDTPSPPLTAPASRGHRRLWPIPRGSLKLRLVVLFLVLALAVVLTFIRGAQEAFTLGWRDTARPLLTDYIDRLAAEITVDGHPDVARARALVQQLPVTVDIQGPELNWRSHPEQTADGARRRPRHAGVDGDGDGDVDHEDEERRWRSLLERRTADGHVIRFGLNEAALERRPHMIGYTLVILLTLTLLAYLYVRRLLRPLDDIRRGAQRFGAGDFGAPIPVRHPDKPDELGHLAQTINTMGQDIARMLEAQRALLLAISHELRSPLTRARLHTELLPETGEVQPQRAALLRDLGEMARLISDLLESERLASRHAALNLESTEVVALARALIDELALTQPRARDIELHAPASLAPRRLDPVRLRLLLRNLLDNALRHGAQAQRPPELRIVEEGPDLVLDVRDHGPGVPEDQLKLLAQPFFRPDAARSRGTGGVGLGLYLCRLVAQAHGGSLTLHNAAPGLRVTVRLPRG
ncbi:HAMP domain-containing sensor histidine kinase [Hylemonella gracilis]|uniref:histidine kinase n=1 Tax=Hylemonella gracilis ATCC 19624 TaxID=887062 RepID=F3KPB7_9BURK|nr:HAMP domain-containing sensor histidine kinase [Hylemonella gracilis]EGI78358.1 integral membrane sensor signal transduction histidine kinase [Hylemonella gracilis ATCC 19624]